MREVGAEWMPGRAEWRPDLRRKLAVLLVVKVIALALLWALCFSPQHREAVNESAMGQQLSLDSAESHSGASP